MESSAKGLLQVMNWVKLKRDKSNYVSWHRHVKEVLEAMGCEAAITEEFAELKFKDEDYDSEPSGDDSDDFLKPSFSSPTPKPQRTSNFQTYQASSVSSKQTMKIMKKRRKQEERFEKMKRKIDAKARTTIRNSIDAKAFERSTYDCNTAYELYHGQH